MAFTDILGALLGISAFQPPSYPGPHLGDPAVNAVRRALGGQLESVQPVRTRFYLKDIERAQEMAATGDLALVGQFNEAMRQDGVVKGMLSARASVVDFPRHIYGDAEIAQTLMSKVASDRDVYDEMIPSTEAKAMVADGEVCGISVGTLEPVRGRNFPILVRRLPTNLFYLVNRNTWFYRSLAGMLPITPGLPDADGTVWILHMPGGRLTPWSGGLWATLMRSYVLKLQSLYARNSWEAKHSNPLRIGFSTVGASETEREGFLKGLIDWSLNGASVLPPGWDAKLISDSGRGYEVYQQSIDTANQEIATALCGSAVMLQGTVGFSGIDTFKIVADNLLRSTARGWDHTVSTQILPSFIASHWGEEALRDAVTVETDCTPPKDRKVEADTYTSLATAAKALTEVLATQGMGLDLSQLMTRFGIPTIKLQEAPVQAAPAPEVLAPVEQPAKALNGKANGQPPYGSQVEA